MKKCVSSALTVFLALSCASVLAPAHGAVNLMWAGNCPVVNENATCPDSKYVTFYLHTRSNPIVGQVVDLKKNNLTASKFIASKPTKIIIHGLNRSSIDFADMRKEFLTKGRYNVFSVDWTYLAQGDTLLCFAAASTSAQHVGVCTGGLVAALRKARAKDIHIIGHGLGAHVAGYAGNSVLPNMVPRITGLDPVDWGKSSPDGQLSPKVATFVDVIHTCVDNFGAVGHADFFVNGGFTQPGCDKEGRKKSFDCSHFRSVLLFTESINTVKGFYGYSCPPSTALFGGVCLFHGSATILMGNSASKRTRGVIQVSTSSQDPFAYGKN